MSDDFRFLGRVAFTIKGVAAGERLVFVQSTGKHIKRLVIVQFESILPASEEFYRYDISDGMLLDGLRFRHSTFAFSTAEARRENPHGEAALTSIFLRERGYVVDDELIASRFATISGERRRDEMIIFYLKPLADTGHKAQELYGAEERPTDLGRQIGTALTEESIHAFKLVSHTPVVEQKK